MNHGQAEQPGGMTAHDGPVDDDEQKTRTRERGEERDDAEVPKLIGIHAGDPRGAQRKRKREQYAKRRHRAVGRDDERDRCERERDAPEQGYRSLQEAIGREQVESDPLGRG